MTWDELEHSVERLLARCRALKEENAGLAARVASLEAELEAVQALRKERDKLKTEKEAVKRRVGEMLQQLDKMQITG